MAFARAALGAAGAELSRDDAHRHAGAAAVAIGAVGEGAAAPEARPNQLAVDLRVDGMTRGSDLRARQLIRQIAARVGCRGVELQNRKRQVVELRHAGLASYVPVRQAAG